MTLAAADPLQPGEWESKDKNRDAAVPLADARKGRQTSAACGVYSRDTQIENGKEDVVNYGIQHVPCSSGGHLRPDYSLHAKAKHCLKKSK